MLMAFDGSISVYNNVSAELIAGRQSLCLVNHFFDFFVSIKLKICIKNIDLHEQCFNIWYMYIEKYNVYITNNATKKVKKILLEANTPQEAHKKAYVNTHMFTEDITKITDFTNSVVYTHTDGFITK